MLTLTVFLDCSQFLFNVLLIITILILRILDIYFTGLFFYTLIIYNIFGLFFNLGLLSVYSILSLNVFVIFCVFILFLYFDFSIYTVFYLSLLLHLCWLCYIYQYINTNKAYLSILCFILFAFFTVLQFAVPGLPQTLLWFSTECVFRLSGVNGGA